MSDLRQRIAAARHHVMVDVTADDVSSGLSALHRRARQRRNRRRGAGIATLLTLGAVALVLVRRETSVVSPPVSPAPAVPVAVREAPPVAPRATGRPADPAPPVAPLVYRDGSRATPLAPRSQVRLLEQRATIMQTEVVFGGGRFEVAKNPRRRFQVLAGWLVVEAIGTVFTVERTPDDVWVSVDEGRVRVTGPGVVAVLDASERRRFPAGTARDADRVPVVERRPPAAPAESLAVAGRTPDPVRDPAPPLLQPPSLPPPPLPVPAATARSSRDDEIGQSLRDADRARAGGQYAVAAAMLRRVSQRTGDARAPLAGFTLGRLLLEKMRCPAEAAAAFAEVQRLSPAGDLAEDALAREVESWRAAGLSVQARTRAALYAERYPQGRRRDEVRRWGGAP